MMIQLCTWEDFFSFVSKCSNLVVNIGYFTLYLKKLVQLFLCFILVRLTY
ncbi:hypothetical protein LINPERHAP2_LOCUS32745, partial [Linum perenne]